MAQLPTTWKQRDGYVVQIKEMEPRHLYFAAKMLRNKGYVTRREFAAMFFHPPTGEAARDAWEAELASGFGWPSPRLEAIETQLALRGGYAP